VPDSCENVIAEWHCRPSAPADASPRQERYTTNVRCARGRAMLPFRERRGWIAMRGFRVVVVALALGCSAAGAARAADEPGSADPPLSGRYHGATIVHYRPAAFDEIALLHAPHDYTALLERDALSDRSGPEWLRLEGRLTRIRYEVPPGRSSLEVMRN